MDVNRNLQQAHVDEALRKAAVLLLSQDESVDQLPPVSPPEAQVFCAGCRVPGVRYRVEYRVEYRV